MVSVSPHRSQFGLSVTPDLKALLLVQMVLLRMSNVVSFVFDGMSVRSRILEGVFAWTVDAISNTRLVCRCNSNAFGELF